MGAADGFGGGRMHDPSGVEVLGRRLKHFGALLLAGAMVAFIYAVGFTTGVDGLLEGLVIAFAGLLVPAVVLLWIGWVLTSSSYEEDYTLPVVPATGGKRAGWISHAQAYLIAIAAVALAIVIRSWLTPYMGSTMLSPTFLLAVTVSAWVGGMGPAILATVLSVPVLWFVFLGGPSPTDLAGRSGDLVSLALFAAVALSIAGIASALRLTQSRSALLRADVRARDAALDESEARFRDMADEAPAMIWMSDPAGQCVFFNRAWYEFTGRSPEQELGEGWLEGVHPQDQRRCMNTFRNAMQRREAFKMEYRLRRGDGTYRRIMDNGRPRIDRDGRFVGFIGACMEIADVPVLT